MALPKHATLEIKIWHYLNWLICIAVFFFLIAPIIVIIPLAFNAEPYFTFSEEMLRLKPEAFSLRWFRDLFSDPDWMRSIKNSFFIAIIAAIIATTLGTIAALGLNRKEMPYKGFIMAILISPMIVPLIISAAALYSFFARLNLVNTYTGIILSHVVLGIPFVMITVTASLSGFDQSLIRASQSLGASQSRTFFKVIMPLLLPGIISGALFAFITSLDEVVLANFIASAEQRTMPVQMFSGLRENVSPTILALAVILVTISVFLLVMLEIIRRKNEKMRGLSPG